MSDVQKALSRYSAIFQGGERPRFKECGDLKEKLAMARDMYSECIMCERRCGIDRNAVPNPPWIGWLILLVILFE